MEPWPAQEDNKSYDPYRGFSYLTSAISSTSMGLVESRKAEEAGDSMKLRINKEHMQYGIDELEEISKLANVMA
ncbi:hypothetical protein SUGI_1089390 [Cryptomeria japonica]|nr:hypothetical protein SUGI_1089390 [Cryptomeria japonica]